MKLQAPDEQSSYKANKILIKILTLLNSVKETQVTEQVYLKNKLDGYGKKRPIIFEHMCPEW